MYMCTILKYLNMYKYTHFNVADIIATCKRETKNLINLGVFFCMDGMINFLMLELKHVLF